MDLRALLREAAHALDAPLAAFDPSLRTRLWAAHDALTVEALNHPVTPDCSETPKSSETLPEIAQNVIKSPKVSPASYQNAIESARNDQHDVRSARDDRRDHDRHPPRVL